MSTVGAEAGTREEIMANTTTSSRRSYFTKALLTVLFSAALFLITSNTAGYANRMIRNNEHQISEGYQTKQHLDQKNRRKNTHPFKIRGMTSKNTRMNAGRRKPEAPYTPISRQLKGKSSGRRGRGRGRGRRPRPRLSGTNLQVFRNGIFIEPQDVPQYTPIASGNIRLTPVNTNVLIYQNGGFLPQGPKYYLGPTGGGRRSRGRGKSRGKSASRDGFRVRQVVTRLPTFQPSASPSKAPSIVPSLAPSFPPSITPSLAPSISSAPSFSSAPSLSAAPSSNAPSTSAPTTAAPTMAPTESAG